MKTPRHFFLVGIFLLLLCNLHSQIHPCLDFSDPGSHIQNTIEFTLPYSDYKYLKEVRNEKTSFKRVRALVNETKSPVESFKLRGQSSLQFRRKCFNVTLKKNILIKAGNEIKELNEFYLISLSMDQNYFRSAISYKMLNELGLFPLFFAFTEVKINGDTEGLYLLMEKPHEYMMKENGSPCMIRKRGSMGVKDVKYKAKKTPFDKQDFIQAFFQIYNPTENHQGEDFYLSLSRQIDLAAYFDWLGFNFFILNGDYLDELFLYAHADSQSIKYGVLPWDYDDILFENAHHQGSNISQKGWQGKFIYSGKEAFDRKLVQDKFIHSKYLHRLNQILQHLSPEKIQQIFQEVYEELHPFYQDSDLIAMSSHDLNGATNMDQLKGDMEMALSFLQERRSAILGMLLEKDLSLN